MDNFIKNWILPNWQRKLIALITALIVWSFVNQSITATKTLIGVPIRIVNLPPDKTISGLLPNGVLSRRIAITIQGRKRVIDSIEPGDIEVILDASNAPREWLIEIGKKNLISLNPDIDISRGISSVSHQEFLIKMTRLVTAQIPLTIVTSGKLPREYEFLGVWPKYLVQTVSGPEEAIDKLKIEGIRLEFNLDEISREQLRELKTLEGDFFGDEKSFQVPEDWKKVEIPYLNSAPQPLNDPSAENLRLDFLRKQYVPLRSLVPIRVFYPLETSEKINPRTYSLKTGGHIIEKNGITIYNKPLFAYEVSQLFIDIVKNNMEISIIASPSRSGEELKWSVEFIEPQVLEDRYVAFQHKRHPLGTHYRRTAAKQREIQWRQRFRAYMQNITLWKTKTQRLDLESVMKGGHIYVDENQ